MKNTAHKLVIGYELLVRSKNYVFTMNHELKRKRTNNSLGFSSLAVVAVMGLLMALFLGLVGTGVVKLPGSNGIPTSPIPISDPVEDDEACNDPFNAECEDLDNDPEDLTPAEIQKALEED